MYISKQFLAHMYFYPIKFESVTDNLMQDETSKVQIQ